MFVSPDFRYLTRDLLDISIDPLKEEQKKERTLVAGLVNGNFPSLGSAAAPVTLTVFSDFECPYCARFAEMLKRDVLPIEGKNIRLVFRHFPLPNHSWARIAARASACVQAQSNEAFWVFQDYVFEHQQEFNSGNVHIKVISYIRNLKNLDRTKFEACVQNNVTESIVARDIAFAEEVEVNGTPTVFVNGKRMSGIVGPEQLLTIVREKSTNARLKQAAIATGR